MASCSVVQYIYVYIYTRLRKKLGCYFISNISAAFTSKIIFVFKFLKVWKSKIVNERLQLLSIIFTLIPESLLASASPILASLLTCAVLAIPRASKYPCNNQTFTKHFNLMAVPAWAGLDFARVRFWPQPPLVRLFWFPFFLVCYGNVKPIRIHLLCIYFKAWGGS